MRRPDANVRLAAVLLLAGGLALCGLALFAEQLGLGGQDGQGTFGWKQVALVIVGGLAIAVGGLLLAAPLITSGPEDRERIRDHVRRLSDRNMRLAAVLLLAGGLALCGLALFAEQLGLGGQDGQGTFGWKQVALVIVGGLAIAVGGLLLAAPLITSSPEDRERIRGHVRGLARQQRTSRWISLLGLLLVLGVYAAVQLMFLKPPSLEGGDQLDYFSTADTLPDVSATHRHLRLGLLLPVRGAIELFGYSEAAYYAVPLLSGLALAGSTYVLARMLFGWGVAVAAALLVTLNPYVLWDSSHLLPDVPAAAALVGAMASLVGAGLLHRRHQVDAWSALLLALGGFLLGWAYLTREYLVIAFPLALVVFYAYRIPWRRIGWVALGAAPALILEAVWGAVNYGDPLVRFSATAAAPDPSFNQDLGAAPRPETDLVLDAVDLIVQLPSNFLDRGVGWVFILLMAGLMLYGIVAAARGDRRFLLLTVWAGGLWLVLTMIDLVPIILTGGESTLLRLEVFRYWLPILPGLVIGGLAVVRELIRILVRHDELARPLTLVSLAGITVVTLNVGIASISYSTAFIRNGAVQYLQFREFLRNEGASYSSVYTDYGAGQSLALVLPMYTRTTFGSQIWQGDIRALGVDTEFLSVDEVEGELVAVRPESIRWLSEHKGFAPPTYLLNPPPNWQPVMISDNGAIIAYRATSGHPRTVLHAATARDWHNQNRSSPVDPTIRNGRAILQVGDGQTVSVFDGRGDAIRAREAHSEKLIHRGEVVWGRVQMASEGLGSPSILCHFYARGQRTSAATSVREPYTERPEPIDYRCRAPGTGGPFQVRVAIYIRGPTTVILGGNAVYPARG